MCRRLVIAITVLGLFVGQIASAQSDDDVAKAREHYLSGTRLFDLGKFAEAVKEYELAYQHKDDPALLYNLGQAHRLAGNAKEALHFYKTFLNKVPRASNRAEVTTKIQELERLLEQQQRSQKLPPDQPIPIERQPEPEPPPQRGPAPEPEPEPQVTPPTAPPPRADRPPVPGRAKKIAGLAVGAAGLAMAGVGIGMGVVALQAANDVTADAKAMRTFDPAKEDLGQTAVILEGVFLGAGALAVAGGVVLYVLGHREARRAAGPTATLVPLASPRAVGGLVEVRF